ncbi:MAG: hypothetical protein DI562_12735 [Stenotrophomonas acidaminiphila]|nr:MAG: hypothetical protein DI562_12735 [Stenotrophomonas acidaminiphila]
MRTLIFIAIGLLLMGIAMRLASPHRRRAVMGVFSVGWLLAVLWNLRTGMSHGYSLQEELPIQAGIYLVPVAAGWWWAWKTRQH